MKYFLPLTAFILSSAHATTGTGEYFYGPDTSENIACQVAEDFARTDAIRNFLGEDKIIADRNIRYEFYEGDIHFKGNLEDFRKALTKARGEAK